jgi:hypothetical protein
MAFLDFRTLLACQDSFRDSFAMVFMACDVGETGPSVVYRHGTNGFHDDSKPSKKGSRD